MTNIVLDHFQKCICFQNRQTQPTETAWDEVSHDYYQEEENDLEKFRRGIKLASFSDFHCRTSLCHVTHRKLLDCLLLLDAWWFPMCYKGLHWKHLWSSDFSVLANTRFFLMETWLLNLCIWDGETAITTTTNICLSTDLKSNYKQIAVKLAFVLAVHVVFWCCYL